jgi:hypothetical protein
MDGQKTSEMCVQLFVADLAESHKSTHKLEYWSPMLLHNAPSSKYGTSVTAATDYTMRSQIKKGHAAA